MQHETKLMNLSDETVCNNLAVGTTLNDTSLIAPLVGTYYFEPYDEMKRFILPND